MNAKTLYPVVSLLTYALLATVSFSVTIAAVRTQAGDTALGSPAGSPPAAGALDASFGSGGIVVTNIRGGNDFATCVALQADGKIVTAGTSHNGSKYDFAVVRYNVDGSLDTTFNGTGKVITSIGPRPFDPYGDKAYGVAVQGDGKIVVAGSSFDASAYAEIAVVRYNPDGSLDTNFNGTGIVTTDNTFTNDFVYGLVLQPDGKIVVGGHSNEGPSFDQFEIVRYNSDGSLDTTFNGTGVVKVDIGGAGLDDAFAIALQHDGKLVLSGLNYAERCCRGDFVTARFNSDGTLDTSFNGTGSIITPTATFFQSETDVPSHGVTVQGDGKVVVAGLSALGTDGDFTLARYTAGGTLDTSFNGTGISKAFGAGAARGVVVQGDGKIVAAGTASAHFALGRYNSDGTLDVGFNGTGKVITSVGTSSTAHAVVLQTDGKIIAAGGSANASFALARYHSGSSQPLVLKAAGSRKVHGSAGTFDVNLPLTGEPGVECRSAGDAHAIVFSFTNDVAGGNASVTSGTAMITGTPAVAGNMLTVNLTGVADQQQVTLLLSDVTDTSGQVLANTSVNVKFLVGDTTANSTVNGSDVGQTKAESGAPVATANFRTDVNASGTINGSDIGQVKANVGHTLP